MNHFDDGGPAFPQPDVISNEHKDFHRDQGMSLRDHFAGLAMQALIGEISASWDEIASAAYRYADAMLKARNK